MSTAMTLTCDMPIQLNGEFALRVRRGRERLVVVPQLPLTMFVDAHERQCQANHSGQTLERIRERHGFGATEAVAVLICLPFEAVETMTTEVAHRILYQMIATHNRGMRIVERAASVDTLPKGQDAKQGLAGTEGSAVGATSAETPIPSPIAPVQDDERR